MGQRLRFGRQQKPPPATIVGVVPDTLMEGPVDSEGSDGAGVFLPLAHIPPVYVTVVARGHVPPLQLLEPLRRSAARLNPNLAIYSATTPERSFEQALLEADHCRECFRFLPSSLWLLAALGLYGVVSLAVNQRYTSSAFVWPLAPTPARL